MNTVSEKDKQPCIIADVSNSANREICYECNGTGLISSCCGEPAYEGTKEIGREVKGNTEHIYITGNKRYTCELCGKFCRSIPCHDCYGEGYEIDDESE